MSFNTRLSVLTLLGEKKVKKFADFGFVIPLKEEGGKENSGISEKAINYRKILFSKSKAYV